jgi:hypothetical protein
MESVVDEIRSACRKLGFADGDVRLLPSAEATAVIGAVLRHFVASGDRRWWWEGFSLPGASIGFPADDGWRHLERIVPDSKELVWFIAEDDQLPHYPVFETTTRHAVAIIGECYGFEFYLVARNLLWLVCENHHGRLFAIGDEVEARLNGLDPSATQDAGQ